jgi:ABC-2 type transport system permease protein
MLYDILTILRKDLKEIFVQRGSLRSGLTNILIMLAIIGVLFPLQMGQEWLVNPIGLISVAWMPLFMSMGLVADAFAGERERHTLETLLSSRLSDQAILFGKLAAAVVYGMSIAIAGMLIGALTANLRYPGAGFYPALNLLGALLFTLLGTLLVSGLGVLVSLHASSVRQAYQRMSLGFIILWLPLILGPQVLPDNWLTKISRWLIQVNLIQAAFLVGAILLALDVLLIGLAITQFKRSRLILD